MKVEEEVYGSKESGRLSLRDEIVHVKNAVKDVPMLKKLSWLTIGLVIGGIVKEFIGR